MGDQKVEYLAAYLVLLMAVKKVGKRVPLMVYWRVARMV